MLSKEEINALPLFDYEPEIFLVQTQEDLDYAVDLIKKEECLGFDTEAKPNFRKNSNMNSPALIQIATAKLVILIPLTKVPFEKKLADILADPKIIKAGVAILDDMKSLQKLVHFKPAGICDLADMTKHLGIKSYGLRTMTAGLLGQRISKNVRCSNWEKKELSSKQLHYAALDAYLSRELFIMLGKQFIEKDLNFKSVIKN